MKKLISITIEAVESYTLINQKENMKDALLNMYIAEQLII